MGSNNKGRTFIFVVILTGGFAVGPALKHINQLNFPGTVEIHSNPPFEVPVPAFTTVGSDAIWPALFK